MTIKKNILIAILVTIIIITGIFSVLFLLAEERPPSIKKEPVLKIGLDYEFM